MISSFSTSIRFNTDNIYLAKIKRDPRQMNRIRQSAKIKYTNSNLAKKISEKTNIPMTTNRKILDDWRYSKLKKSAEIIKHFVTINTKNPT